MTEPTINLGQLPPSTQPQNLDTPIPSSAQVTQPILAATNRPPSASLEGRVSPHIKEITSSAYAALMEEALKLEETYNSETLKEQDRPTKKKQFQDKVFEMGTCKRTDLEGIKKSQQEAIDQLKVRLREQEQRLRELSPSNWDKIQTFLEGIETEAALFYQMNCCQAVNGKLFFTLRSGFIEAQNQRIEKYNKELPDENIASFKLHLVLQRHEDEDCLLKSQLAVLHLRKVAVNRLLYEQEVRDFIKSKAALIAPQLGVSEDEVKKIAKLELLGDETHNESRRPYKITIGSEKQEKHFVYKPRPAALDSSILKLLHRLNRDFREYWIICCGDCSIWQFIESNTTQDPEAAMRNALSSRNSCANKQIQVLNYAAFKTWGHDFHPGNFLYGVNCDSASERVGLCPIDLECRCIGYYPKAGQNCKTGLFNGFNRAEHYPPTEKWPAMDAVLETWLQDAQPDQMRCRVVCASTSDLFSILHTQLNPNAAIETILSHMKEYFPTWTVSEDLHSLRVQLYVDFCNGDIPYFYTEDQKKIYCGNPNSKTKTPFAERLEQPEELKGLRSLAPEIAPSETESSPAASTRSSSDTAIPGSETTGTDASHSDSFD